MQVSGFFARHLAPGQIILDIMILCMIAGAVDYYRKNKWGLGRKFEEAFGAFFPLFVMMGGIIALVPLIGRIFAPLAGPVFGLTGSDPGMMPGMILANDMGGFPLAGELALDGSAAGFGGMIVGSMLGVNVVFNVPVALGMIRECDRPFAARGFLCGFITVPVGALCGGLAAGYPIRFILFNMIPVLIVSGVIAVLMRMIPDRLVRAFIGFGRFITLIALTGIVMASAAELAGIDTKPLHLDSVKTG